MNRMIAAIAVLAVVPLAAQDKQEKPKKEPAPPPIAVSGCVVKGSDVPTRYELHDETGTPTHYLTGMNMKTYLGKRVEVVGTVPDSKKLQIKTGLLPNPTVAGQRGSMDPARAANAGAGGSAPVGDVQLIEFRVKSVKPLDGGCEVKK